MKLDSAKHCIELEVGCQGAKFVCPRCGAADQAVHDRMRRSWRHLNLFQFEAWLHADVPRVGCSACGKTTQLPVPWAREGSGFTLLFEALALSMCQGLPVRQAARMLRVRDKQLWSLALTLKAHFDAVVRCMLDNRSNAFVEAMNGLMQQARRAARGFRTAANFIQIAYLRLSKLTHLPASPFATASPR